MSEGKNHSDLIRYLNGEMTHREAHAFEKQALNDPFLQDAIDGAEDIGAESFIKDSETLNKTLIPNSKPNFYLWKIAAVITLLIVSGYTISFLTRSLKTTDEVARTDTPEETDKRVIEKKADKKQEIADEEPVITENLEQEEPPKPASSVSRVQRTEETPSPPKEEVLEVQEEVIEDLVFEESIAAMTSSDMEEDKFYDQEESIEEKVQEERVVAKTKAFAKVKRSSSQRNASSASSAAEEKIANERSISGSVTDDFGEGLPGVNVVIKGTTIGVTSDLDGTFLLSPVNNKTVLVISSVGITSQEIQVGERDSLKVQLSPDATSLQEVVVTALGSERVDEGYKNAKPVNGVSSFKDYLETELKYPEEALNKGIKGRIVLQLTISPTGMISNIEVKKGLGSGCDEEAIRLIEDGPSWSPATKDGFNIETKVRIRVKFDPE